MVGMQSKHGWYKDETMLQFATMVRLRRKGLFGMSGRSGRLTSLLDTAVLKRPSNSHHSHIKDVIESIQDQHTSIEEHHKEKEKDGAGGFNF